MMTDLPVVAQDWVRGRCVTSDLEILTAHKIGFVKSDAYIAMLWAGLDPASAEVIRNIFNEKAKLESISDKYFSLMLINLFESWFIIENPKKKLEYLVIYFKNSNMLLIGDKMLPSGVAGIAEVHDKISPVDLADYTINIRIHKWLSEYVVVLLRHELLHRPIL
jgi:hypothetical protein